MARATAAAALLCTNMNRLRLDRWETDRTLLNNATIAAAAAIDGGSSLVTALAHIASTAPSAPSLSSRLISFRLYSLKARLPSPLTPPPLSVLVGIWRHLHITLHPSQTHSNSRCQLLDRHDRAIQLSVAPHPSPTSACHSTVQLSTPITAPSASLLSPPLHQTRRHRSVLSTALTRPLS